jgi:hypothetical protein
VQDLSLGMRGMASPAAWDALVGNIQHAGHVSRISVSCCISASQLQALAQKASVGLSGNSSLYVHSSRRTNPQDLDVLTQADIDGAQSLYPGLEVTLAEPS